MRTIGIKLLCCLAILVFCVQVAVFSADPNLPAAENAKVSGVEKVGNVLTLSYDFVEPNRLGNNSRYQWQYSSNNISFFDIPGAVGRTFIPGEEYVGMYIRGGVIPVNALNISGITSYSEVVGPLMSKSIPDGIGAAVDFGQNAGRFPDAITDLKALGIIDDVSEADLRLDEGVTRAEFAKLVTKVSDWNGKSVYTEGRFSDVTAAHWAAEYIEFTTSLGIFEGFPDGSFRPEGEVLLQDAQKVIVTLLGYKIKAVELGYPMGYITQSATLGLSKGIRQGHGEAVSRGDIFQIVKNALDVDRLTQNSISADGSSSYTVVRGNTLRSSLLEGKSFIEGSGVVTAVYDAFLLEECYDIKRDEVEINSVRYNVGTTHIQDYFGEKIYYSAFKDENTGKRTLNAVSRHKDVEVFIIGSNEYENYQDFEISYTKDKASSIRKAKISKNAAMLYNNRPITDWSQFDIKNGNIKLIDNTADGVYDIVLISDYISVPVKGVNLTSGFINIEDGVYYNGSRSIPFDGLDNSIQNIAYNSEGVEIRLDDIQSGGVVSVFESGDGKFLKVIYCENIVEGMINEISEDYFIIDSDTYEFEEKDILSKEPFRTGNEVMAYLNFEGKIAFLSPQKNTGERYGYILNKRQKNLDNEELYILTSGIIENKEEDPDNDPETENNIKILVAANDDVKAMKLASRYSVKNESENVLGVSNFGLIPINAVVKFRTNADGEIREIILPEIVDLTGRKIYNATDNVFGKTLGIPFGIDENTVVLCIPENDVSSEDDYRAMVKLNDGQQYTVFGYDVNEADSNVKLLVINANMNYNSSDSIGSTTKIAVVQKVSKALNADGEVVTRLVLMTENMAMQISAADYADKNKVASLKTGDVIYYAQNSRREFVDFNLLESLSTADGYYNINKSTANETVFGMTHDITFGRVSMTLNRRINTFSVQLNEWDKEVKENFEVHTTNAPPVFIYEKWKNNVSFGTADDIRTYISSGESADKVFMHIINGIVQGIVLVRD